jgi:predicted nucleic acid-binding Zn ribbon protein
MPVYTYRREDGTTFDYRQKFTDEPLAVDPTTGQRVVRVVQAAGIIFKGSGFYVNDSKNASKASVNGSAKSSGESTSTDTSAEKPAVKEVPKETSTVGAAAD